MPATHTVTQRDPFTILSPAKNRVERAFEQQRERERKKRPIHHFSKHQKQKQKLSKERNPRKKKIGFSLCCMSKQRLGEMMQTIEQTPQPQLQPPPQSQSQSQQLVVQNSAGSLSFNSNLSKEDEEMSRSALSTFRAKEEEIERKKMEVREKVQAQLGRVEEETKRLATIREVCASGFYDFELLH